MMKHIQQYYNNLACESRAVAVINHSTVNECSVGRYNIDVSQTV